MQNNVQQLVCYIFDLIWRYIYSVDVMLIQSGVCGGGYLFVRLVRYVNLGGNGENGNFCDGCYFFMGFLCDYCFIICVDKENG